MPRPESPCGTHAAYKRHKRRKEPVDEACREAAAEHVRAQRAREAERAAQNAAAVDEATAGGTVRQLVAYGEFEEVTVPEHEEPLESARWRLRRARAAILVAGPRDMPALLRMVAGGIVEPERVITRRYRLDEVDEAYQALARGEIVGRAIIEMDSE